MLQLFCTRCGIELKFICVIKVGIYLFYNCNLIVGTERFKRTTQGMAPWIISLAVLAVNINLACVQIHVCFNTVQMSNLIHSNSRFESLCEYEFSVKTVVFPSPNNPHCLFSSPLITLGQNPSDLLAELSARFWKS